MLLLLTGDTYNSWLSLKLFKEESLYWTSLRKAIEYGNLQILSLLMKNGANLNLAVEDGLQYIKQLT